MPTPAVARRARAGFVALACVIALGGCASVPEVESRLQNLRFHPNMYVVQAGDTLATVAFRYELTPEQLASLNPGARAGLVPGQRINVRPGTELPEAVRARVKVTNPPQPVPAPAAARPIVVSPAPTPAEAVAAVEPAPVPVPVPAPVPVPVPGDAGAWPNEEIVPDDLDALDAGVPVTSREALDDELQRYVGEWTWPTDGAVARGFAPESIGGQGVDIAGVPGQDVRAARAGTVVYSGRDLSGGGNLVIVRHDDDLMTTYSHADALFVTEDDVVRAGDPIASLGWNSERESVLRFEVRRDGNPLDPMTFLPPR